MGGLVSGLFGGGGDDAADAAEYAAELSADAQMQALEYLQETEELPLAIRDVALEQLTGAYDISGQENTQQDFIDRAQASPLYSQIMSNQQSGEDAIMRNAAATGGLRSGNVQDAMFDFSTNLQNQALLESYNQQVNDYYTKVGGLQGLAGLGTNQNAIANQMNMIGTTQAQGQTAAAQALQTADQNQMSNIMGLGQLGIAAYMASDRRLKANLQQIDSIGPHRIYKWVWNEWANEQGFFGKSIGCIADEVFQIVPAAIKFINGYEFINYDMIGVFASEGV